MKTQGEKVMVECLTLSLEFFSVSQLVMEIKCKYHPYNFSRQNKIPTGQGSGCICFFKFDRMIMKTQLWQDWHVRKIDGGKTSMTQEKRHVQDGQWDASRTCQKKAWSTESSLLSINSPKPHAPIKVGLLQLKQRNQGWPCCDLQYDLPKRSTGYGPKRHLCLHNSVAKRTYLSARLYW